jgi:hypothetical protein
MEELFLKKLNKNSHFDLRGSSGVFPSKLITLKHRAAQKLRV